MCDKSNDISRNEEINKWVSNLTINGQQNEQQLIGSPIEPNLNPINSWNVLSTELKGNESNNLWSNPILNNWNENRRPILKGNDSSLRIQANASIRVSNGPNDWFSNYNQLNQNLNQNSNSTKRRVRFETPSQQRSTSFTFNSEILPKNMNRLKHSYNRNDADREETSDESNTIFDFENELRFGFGRNGEFGRYLPSISSNSTLTSSASVANPLVNAFTDILRHSQSELKSGYKHLSQGVCSVLMNDPIWSTQELVPNLISGTQDHVTQVAQKLRNVAKKVEANYTWSGQLPRKSRTKNPIFSCKVFLGGIPYDLTDSDLHLTFAPFGPIQIQWPGKDIKSAIDGAAANKAGYVYVIFETYDSVAALLNSCSVMYKDSDTGCRYYYNISSRRQKAKEVQVIPFDIGDRFYMKGSFTGQMEHSRTVFVGALHGMLTADGLAKVMDDLFGGVIFTGLDTDKHKYPLGSGRVSFDNQDSYLKAVSAAFVEIKSARFKKKIQIDPYIENESICAMCKNVQQSPIFCRDLTCFRYFCRKCWDVHHSEPDSHNHRPIIKNKPLV